VARMELDTRTTMQEQESSTTDRRIPATLRLDPEDYEFYQEWAHREDRSMSYVLRIALERYRASQQTEVA